MPVNAGLESGFEGGPMLSTPQRGELEARLDQLKEQLLEPVLNSTRSAAAMRELRRAADEAAALAWFTVCPILVLPALLEEKVRSALQWWERQEMIRPRQSVGCEAGVRI